MKTRFVRETSRHARRDIRHYAADERKACVTKLAVWLLASVVIFAFHSFARLSHAYDAIPRKDVEIIRECVVESTKYSNEIFKQGNSHFR